MLDPVAARLRVIRIRRRGYGCRVCGTIHQAPAPERSIAKGLATLGLLAYVLVSQVLRSPPDLSAEPNLRPVGIELDRSTLPNWVG
jgi:transposase